MEIHGTVFYQTIFPPKGSIFFSASCFKSSTHWPKEASLNIHFKKMVGCLVKLHQFSWKDLVNIIQLSHEKKKNLLLSIESWLANRDPYSGLLKSPYFG